MLKLNTLSGFGSGVSGGAGLRVPVKGYVMGGGGANDTEILTYSTSTMATSTDSDMTTNNVAHEGMGDNDTYAYVTGGNTGAKSSATERFTYSSETYALNTDSDLSVARLDHGCCSDLGTFGYSVGGNGISADPNYVSTTDKITFATSVNAAETDSDLSVATQNINGSNDGATYAYFAGGSKDDPSEILSTTQQMTLASGVIAINTDSSISSARSEVHPVSDYGSNGYIYFAGGANAATAERLTIASQVTAAHTDANLSVGRSHHAPCSDAVTYGYWVSGHSGANTPVTDRITFATGVSAAHTDADKAVANNGIGSFSDAVT